MKKFHLIFVFILLYSTKSYSSFNKDSIKITITIDGFARGFKDSTWLYLDKAENYGTSIDSAMILNGRFHFKVKKNSSDIPKNYAIRTRSFIDYKFFWVENKSIEISGIKGNFRQSLIKGSKSQELIDSFEKKRGPLEYEIDSLLRNVGTTDSIIYKRTLELEKELNVQSAKLLSKNTDQFITTYLLSLYCVKWGKELTSSIYTKIPNKFKLTSNGFKIKNYLHLNRQIKIGDHFVDFQQNDINKIPLNLSDFKGKYILLDFWASWCGGCRKENTYLVELYSKYKSSGFEIFGVSQDVNEQNWKSAIEKDKLIWPNVSELKGGENAAALMYGVYEIPTNYLIDPNGKIIAKNLRGKELDKKLQELIKVNTLIDNLELKRMVEKDQEIRLSNDNINLEATDRIHRNRVFELLVKDSIKTNQDKLNAALILQHTTLEYCGDNLKSISAENYLLAYQLSKSALENGFKKAANFVAVTYDRYLLYTKGFQKYGTQRVFDEKTGDEVWAPIDKSTTDKERAFYGVPPLDSLLAKYKMKSF